MAAGPADPHRPFDIRQRLLPTTASTPGRHHAVGSGTQECVDEGLLPTTASTPGRHHAVGSGTQECVDEVTHQPRAFRLTGGQQVRSLLKA
ncbi:hypothetical protein AB4Z54_66810, partial [Streptomyces sp. MCAF7]